LGLANVAGEEQMTLPTLSPEEALIFRITHRDNLPWILHHGLFAKSSQVLDPNFRKIGDLDLIDKRSRHPVPAGPRGTLGGYIPFYFTPFSIMMYKINTGHGGIQHVPNEELVILVSSLFDVLRCNAQFVFTDRHAYLATAQYFADLAHLGQIDWPLLRSRNFKHDPEHPERIDRYQAEALIWEHLPVEALVEICTSSVDGQREVQDQLDQRGLGIKATIRRDWYF
jgi:hypothetical protein